MNKILLLAIIFVVFAKAQPNDHQYNIYDMNGRNQGIFKEELSKASLSEFAKKHHGSILVKKNSTNKKEYLIIQSNKLISLAQLGNIQRNIDFNSSSLQESIWIEIEKKEIIKICMYNKVLAWETPLDSRIINDSCLAIQAPDLITVDSLKVFFSNDNESYKINLATGMKYFDFKNIPVLRSYEEKDFTGITITTENATLYSRKEIPNDSTSFTSTYLVDKYPVTNCEIIQQLWDNIPQNSNNLDSLKNDAATKWIERKASSFRFENCPVHDTAANTISLYQAMEYANARSIREGLKPYYKFSEAESSQEQILSKGQYIIGYSDFSIHEKKLIQASIDYTSNGYRLPFYDEWMMFARGGDNSKKSPWGDSATYEEITKFARFDSNKKYDESEPVGQLQPNGYGLYDLFGLVEEHVLFEESNPFSYLKNNYSKESPSCFKGGNIHSDWKYITYEYKTPNYYSANLGGFRLIRKLK